jgi:hypothetical protein
MKHYFIHDGHQQHGPFTLETIKTQGLTENTPVWHEGLTTWTPAGQIEELRVLLSQTPPPFQISPPVFHTPPPIPPHYDPFPEPKRDRKSLVYGLSAAVVLLVGIIYFTNNRSEAAVPNSSNTISAIQVDSAVGSVAPSESERLKELEQKEQERQAANEALTKKNMEYRNNWSKYITHSTNHYRVDSWGGIYDLLISVTNNTERILDEVTVKVSYYKENGSLYTEQEVALYNVQPNGSKTVAVPDVSRGTRIETEISSISSRAMHFCYNNLYEQRVSMDSSAGGGIEVPKRNRIDPWFCK